MVLGDLACVRAHDAVERPVLVAVPVEAPHEVSAVRSDQQVRQMEAVGRDMAARVEVARFLEKAGSHKVVVLDEQANQGRTLIEKFEAHASQANYAVILLTGDDVGGTKAPEGPVRPRARQNVVFELGFFFGSVGRERVAVLYEPDVEKPSDIGGLVYIALDPTGAWKGSIVKELRAAGLDFDANTA